MKIDHQTFVKNFFSKMEKYYDEVEMQKLLNIVEEIESKQTMSVEEAIDIVSKMKLRDRHTAIALAIIYQKPMAYIILQNTTDMLIPTEVEKLKNSITNKTEDEFFKGYTNYDYYCLKRSIADDALDELDNPIWDIEKEILFHFVQYKEGKRGKVLSK